MSVEEKTVIQASGKQQGAAPLAGGFARPMPGGRPGARPAPPPPVMSPAAGGSAFGGAGYGGASYGAAPFGSAGPAAGRFGAPLPDALHWQPDAAPVSALENPLLAASRELISVMAQLSTDTEGRDPLPFRDWAALQIQRFERQCAQQDLNEEIRFYARYVLCTALDELVIKTPWGGDGLWSRQSLLSQFHGETGGGERFFQLLEYVQQAPARNLHLLELMYVCMGLGFEGKYHLDPRGHVQLDSIRDNLFHLIRLQKGEPERDLSPHWQRVVKQRNKLARYFPLWVVAAVMGVMLLGTFSGFTYLLAEKSRQVTERLQTATTGKADDFFNFSE